MNIKKHGFLNFPLGKIKHLIGLLVILVLITQPVSAGFFGDVFNKITGWVTGEAEECAASISITFNQDVYYEGDFFKVTTEVFDSQGNRIPNYPFYISMYAYSEDGEESETEEGITNEQGYVEQIDSALRIVESVKILYKVYTEETESCSSVEDSAEIEAIYEETEEEEARPEPAEPETCAARIDVNFNQDVYYQGDFFKITVEVFDSQGNRIPNVPFYISTYLYSEDRWDSPAGSETTNEQGYHEHSDSTLRIVETGKFLYKFYTEETSSCSSVEDTAEIEFIKEEIEEEEARPEPEPEPRPEPEPAPTVCAAKIEINFDKEIYYVRDEFKIVIEVFDSQGNHLPNYLFYTQAYDDGMWHSTGRDRTDERGYKIHKDIIRESQVHLFGENKFKIYTESYTNCNSVEDLATIEIRRKERPKPVPCGIGTCIPKEEEEEEPEEIPEDKIFYKCNGCELEGKCYPIGYRKEGKYCSENNEFIKQLGAGTCDNSFECKSNVCVNGGCISGGLIKKIIRWFKKFIGGEPKPPKPEDEVDCSKLLIEKDIGEYEYKESGYGGFKESQAPLISDEGEQIGTIKCCVAQYLDENEKRGMALVCPYENREYVENLINIGLKQASASGANFILQDYKGQNVYVDKWVSMVWAHKNYAIASGRAYEEDSVFPEVIADAYLDKYPSDLGEIEISGVEEEVEGVVEKERDELSGETRPSELKTGLRYRYVLTTATKEMQSEIEEIYLDVYVTKETDKEWEGIVGFKIEQDEKAHIQRFKIDKESLDLFSSYPLYKSDILEEDVQYLTLRDLEKKTAGDAQVMVMYPFILLVLKEINGLNIDELIENGFAKTERGSLNLGDMTTHNNFLVYEVTWSGLPGGDRGETVTFFIGVVKPYLLIRISFPGELDYDLEKIEKKAFELKEYDDYYIKGYIQSYEEASICEKITDIEERDNCYRGVAGKTEDASVCEKIANRGRKSWCYRDIAEITGDASVCDEIASGDSNKDYCYTDVAIKIKDSSLCEKIIDIKEKNECSATTTAILTRDPSLCEEIEVSYEKDYCYRYVAEGIKDASVCEKIIEDSIKELCYHYVAEES